MRKTLGAAVVGAVIALGGADAASAQTAAPAPAPRTASPSIDWTIQDLLADPAAKAVLDRDLPGMEDDPRLMLVMSMTLRAVAQFPEAEIDPAKLQMIQAHLAALPRRGS